ncbi:LacI family DNA-binding transcriptional regulator [Bifidobacterium sp. UTCIF-39]|uniref:LacI family DNA-binding transcriptional regulator n=1 Tax=Bifidobacterium sp. UTCIF-39 TaxID=1465359 RepID=UPI0015E29A63|nr:LacI family DNA-binding transcriptional regulator [Bifidobacterium sp. UTCIF-39]
MVGPTLQDVARRAGVSISTASRALNDGKVKAATKRLVADVANELGYEAPRASGFDLARQQRSEDGRGRIGVVVSRLGVYFDGAPLAKALDIIQGAGFRAVLANIEDRDNAPEKIIRTVAADCEGMLIVSPRVGDDVLRDVGAMTTTVVANRKVEGLSSVFLNEASGAVLALRHLASLGHRVVAYTTVGERYWSSAVKGLSLRFTAERLGMTAVHLGDDFDTSYRSGLMAADALLTEPGVTAMIAHDEIQAVGVVNCLTDRGLRVPQDMSVVSMSDSSLCMVCRPAVSAVDARQITVMSDAATMVLGNIEQSRSGGVPARVRHVAISETFSIRGSTGPAPQCVGSR